MFGRELGREIGVDRADRLDGALEALGWTYREIDGQGTVSGQASGLSQAVALKPDAIVVGGSDAVQQKAGLDDAAKQGIVIVGWHAGPKPGPMEDASVFANVTTDAMEVAKVAAKYQGQFANVKLFTIDEAFGGWQAAQKAHFADGGTFDQIYRPRAP